MAAVRLVFDSMNAARQIAIKDTVDGTYALLGSMDRKQERMLQTVVDDVRLLKNNFLGKF